MASVVPGVRGRLVSTSFALDVLPALPEARAPEAEAVSAYSRVLAVGTASLGAASSIRAIVDVCVLPLFELLGYRADGRRDTPERSELRLRTGDGSIPVLVVPWSQPLDAAWRDAVRLAIAADARWCLCTNGRELRIVDAHRTWGRHILEFDLECAAHVPESRQLLWTLAHARAFEGPHPFLDRVVRLSSEHGTALCATLADGVLEALGVVLAAMAASRGTARERLPDLLEQTLTILYRALFLLFAEARGLVPVWHPIYRDRYSIEAILDSLMAGRRARGVWQALQAIARLAHAGCRAGDLQVTAFNGRLFAPLHTPAAERRRVDDAAIGRALLALGTTSGRRTGRVRIRYRDLDVEQLGAVYEHVLDYEAVRGGGSTSAGNVSLRRTGDARKASGTFYTPRAVAGHVVRQTLAPLVSNRTASEILDLRVVDPAMGSGAFLVAACRFLAAAAEAARLRDGEWHPDEATPDARAALRREVAQRCLFGVDLNPMAVQLARLSLWLATLAGDRPLTFLDHHFAAGDSTAGASLGDALTRAPGGRSRRGGRAPLPLFDAEALGAMLRSVVETRVRLAREPDDDAEVVRRKERALAAMRAPGSPAARWKTLLDLWCASWFWDDGPGPDARMLHALWDEWLHGRSPLPDRVGREWRQRAEAVAAKRRFLHWELEFPEVFFDDQGRRSASGGFDAVIGNPPWDMVRGDSGRGASREARRTDARQLLDFVRGSGVYGAEGRAHINRYQLFVERALQIVRPGGRIGLVLPSGIIADAGSAPLRRRLFDSADVDTIVGLDNRAAIFPIHRSVRFVILAATAGRPTERTACRFGITDPAQLDIGGNDAGGATIRGGVSLSRAFLARVSGEDDLAVPELASEIDVRIVDRVSAAHPWLSDPAGWQARFGRELNASDDRDALAPAGSSHGARPVLEGKHIAPFRVDVGRATHEVAANAAFTTRVPRRPRLAYRDIASAGNRLTLIAAVVPSRAVTTHTLFCLRTPLAQGRQLVLCALLNSFVANYLVRLRVNTHVTVAIVSRLPVPVLGEDDPRAMRLADLARALSLSTQAIEQMDEYAELQALAAHVYGLTHDEFAHVLSTFPLIPASVREAALLRFDALRTRASFPPRPPA
jgi:hypothetical protein